MSRPETRQNGNSSDDHDALGDAPRGAVAPDGQPTGSGSTAGQEDNGPGRPESLGPSNNGAQSEQFAGWNFRDFMIPYILLSLSMQRAHGYFIEQYLRGLGLVNVELSTLYRTLRQMEKNGLVQSTWEPGPEGPARRIYSLTDAGRWWLDSGAAALAGYRDLIDRFFGSYSGPTRGPEGDENEKGA